MHSDPIADLLTRIRNAVRAHKTELSIPHSKIKESILDILKKNKFIEQFKVEKTENFPEIIVSLSEGKEKMQLRRISKPGQRIYINYQDLKPVKNGLGITIVSTSKGLLTGKEAKKQKVGGELICEVH